MNNPVPIGHELYRLNVRSKRTRARLSGYAELIEGERVIFHVGMMRGVMRIVNRGRNGND